MSRTKRTLFLIALALGTLASGTQAGAAALYDASSSLVPTGSTIAANSGTVTLDAAFIQTCSASTLSLTVLDNGSSTGSVEMRPTNGMFSGCTSAITPRWGPGFWVFKTDGTADMHAANEVAGRLYAAEFRWVCSWTGTLFDETVSGPHGSHVAWHDNPSGLHLDDAQGVTGGLCGTGKLSGFWQTSSYRGIW